MADWIRWFIGLHAADTLHLTIVQDGIYRRQLDWYYQNRRPLPDNDQALANIARVSLETWRENAGVIRPFFRKRGGFLHHKKCDTELDRQDSTMKRLSEIGKKGADARHNKSKSLDSEGMPDAKADAMAQGQQDIEVEVEKEEEIEKKDSGADAPSERRGLFGDSISDRIQNKSSKKQKAAAIDEQVKQAFDVWNDMAGPAGLSKAMAFTSTRCRALKARLRDCGGIEGWQHACSLVAKNPFLCGGGDKGWKADIKFMLNPDHFAKLLENGYEENRNVDHAAGPNSGSRNEQHGNRKGRQGILAAARANSSESNS